MRTLEATDLSFLSTSMLPPCNDVDDLTFHPENVICECIMPNIELFSSLSASVRNKMKYKSRNRLLHSECHAEWEVMMELLFKSDCDCRHCVHTQSVRYIMRYQPN